ncbi:F-box domain-containing protein [Sclerotinia borealis F-4128]|uniref:F-box domain-containing protein n=1 Tax=Sclerotinia borealis (strain F-4128) TaxID=1432307 RepID=W9CJ23_SCLBF|nr:F-box domain-containing protein [Sclerotinia borealis F-4128]
MTVYQPVTGEEYGDIQSELDDRPKSPDFLLCTTCGFNASYWIHNSYSVGEKYILKETPLNTIRWHPEHQCPDASITLFLSENSTIPVAKEMHYWRDSDSHFFFMARVEGETLHKVWKKLCPDQFKSVAAEVADYLVELRQFTSDKPQTPDGLDLGKGYSVKPGETFVLTHGDLTSGNIIINDGHVAAIIDWEHGGYLPESYEWKQLTSDTDNYHWQRHLLHEMEKRNIGPFERKDCENFGWFHSSEGDYRSHNSEPFFDQSIMLKCTNFRNYIFDGESHLSEISERNRKRRLLAERNENSIAAEKRTEEIEFKLKVAERKIELYTEFSEKCRPVMEAFWTLSLSEREEFKNKAKPKPEQPEWQS